MTVYVTGDVHGRTEYGSSRFAFKSWPLGRTLTRDDAVIVAGDFGFVWDGSNAEKYWLDWFESKPWTTCFVDGNHENHHALAELPVREWNGGLVHEARPHVLHLMRGEVYDIAGTTVLTMGGAASNDRQYRREGRNWWPEEIPSVEEMGHCRASLDRVGWKVDYVITHTCSTRMLSPTLYPAPGWNYPAVDQLTAFFDELEDHLDYKRWYYGHFHRDANPAERHTVLYDCIVRLGDELQPWDVA